MEQESIPQQKDEGLQTDIMGDYHETKHCRKNAADRAKSHRIQRQCLSENDTEFEVDLSTLRHYSSQGSEEAEEKRMWTQSIWAKCFAEIVGTAIMIALGTGVVAEAVLTGKSNNTAIHFCWGFGVTFGVLASYRISGAHLNPAITLGFASIGEFPLQLIIPYWLSQFFGAFLGAAWTYFNYFNAFNIHQTKTPEYPFGKNMSTNVFCTEPLPNVTFVAAFGIETMCTFFLITGVMVIVDSSQQPKATVWHVASYVGLLVVSIGMAFGANTGYAMNPARDFGPRVFMSIAGWGGQVYTDNGDYFLVPLLAPFVGGFFGAQFMKFGLWRL